MLVQTILAHHLELYHFPLLALMFLAGLNMGWQITSFFLSRKKSIPTGQM